MQTQAQQERAELAASLKSFGDSVQARMAEIASLQRSQLEGFSAQLTLLTTTNEQKMEASPWPCGEMPVMTVTLPDGSILTVALSHPPAGVAGDGPNAQ